MDFKALRSTTLQAAKCSLLFDMKKILSLTRRAIEEYNMISDGDHIAVGLSGGKDSIVLLKALSLYQKFAPMKFQLSAIHVDLGFKNVSENRFDDLQKFCKDLDVPLYIVKTDLYHIIFEDRKENRPCSLCSKMRRGALNSKAVEIKANKVALGHNKEDLIETFLLSLIYEGRLAVFKPTSYLDRTKITVIRPLLFNAEGDIKAAAKRLSMPILENPCPMDKHSQREYMKDLTKHICKDIPFAKDRMFDAIINPQRYDLFVKKEDED